ncbi:MAG: hypothetical protein KAS32_01070, partial [Candidatus Peribacteraceae bacterium]|nr:hypothetical protein [Candidatus Peribacteraceae bacterium]
MTDILADKRRQDDNRTMWNPYWIVSSEFDYADADGTDVALLWSFPAVKYGTSIILIQNIGIQVLTLYAGGTPSLLVGAWTIATDAVTVGGTITVVDADEYIPTADITETTAATYFALTGDWITAALLKTNLAPTIITPADTTVP